MKKDVTLRKKITLLLVLEKMFNVNVIRKDMTGKNFHPPTTSTHINSMPEVKA